jgi:Mg-chelatase subunit ChlD
VLHNDPRILMARELQSQTDLFLGVVIDCSGSMAGFQSMEKAKLFGTLLAEAAKENRGIDVRLFGFTDKVIYDAGSAQRCAVHALRAGGGNNDAAGLWHAALAAKASKRKAKLLVQISDGAPTECTVTALRSLVERLTKRWKFCCAQVAVRPLEEICFPNYVLLEDINLEACTRQFGLVIARLVRKALRGS